MSSTIDLPRPAAPALPAEAPAPAGRLRALGWVAFLAAAAAQAWGLVYSPPAADMGHLQKIMYVHVPTAWAAFVAFFVVAVASLAYLWQRSERADLLAAAAAEVGTVFTALTLALGSIWGRPTWGVWWTWDARLTSTAVLLIVFVSYLALRSLTEDAERRARWSAAVGLLGALNVPIVFMSVRWWRTLHQLPSSPRSLDPTYLVGLAINTATCTLILIYFIARRYRVALTERAAERANDAAALAAGGVYV